MLTFRVLESLKAMIATKGQRIEIRTSSQNPSGLGRLSAEAALVQGCERCSRCLHQILELNELEEGRIMFVNVGWLFNSKAPTLSPNDFAKLCRPDSQ